MQLQNETVGPVLLHIEFFIGHNFEFLKDLKDVGSGMYRYCEQGDGPTVLMEKLQELFDFIVQGCVYICEQVDGRQRLGFLEDNHVSHVYIKPDNKKSINATNDILLSEGN